jgi:hypothetical protein
MNDKEYEIALKFAKNNFDSLIKQIPQAIRRKEASLFNKINYSKQGRLKRLELFYSEMDVIYAAIHNFTICKKGCSHCCYYEIAISDLEVEYIKSKVKTNKIKQNKTNNSCPFLKNGICSIYKYRPFLCRRHLSINDSSKWCELSICNSYNFPLINLTEVDKCYAYLLGPNGLDSLKDIRKVFSRP